MSRTLMHLQSDGTLTKCGQRLAPEFLTTLKMEVTCRSCDRTKGPRKSRASSDAQKLARQNPNHGDDSFPGRGFLRCRNCNRPYTEHPLAVACPYGADR